MARGVVAQISGMASNPYPRPKDQQAINTICEICDRSIRTLDWAAHKNSKKHREAEAKERGETHVANGTTISNGFGGDSNGFTPDTNGTNEFGTTDTFANAGNTGGDSWAVSTGGDAWGSSGGNTDTLSFGNKAGNGGGDRNCYGCGLPGHQKRDCPSGSGSAGMACYGCGEIGHQKRDCPKGSAGGQTCFNCGDLSSSRHRKADCDQPRKPMAGGRACHNCQKDGHMSRDCTEPRVVLCRNCEKPGHIARECDLPTDWTKVKCRNCNEYGHGQGRCPQPKVENAGGNWGNAGDSGAAAGGWGSAADSGAAAGGWGDTTQEPTGDWADNSNAAAADTPLW